MVFKIRICLECLCVIEIVDNDTFVFQDNGECHKYPIMEDEAQEAGIKIERSGKAVGGCPNCKVYCKEIQDKNAQLAKNKEKKDKLKRMIYERDMKLVSNFV